LVPSNDPSVERTGEGVNRVSSCSSRNAAGWGRCRRPRLRDRARGEPKVAKRNQEGCHMVRFSDWGVGLRL